MVRLSVSQEASANDQAIIFLSESLGVVAGGKLEVVDAREKSIVDATSITDI